MAAAVEFGPVHDGVFELDSAPDRHIQGNTATPVGTVERSTPPQAPENAASVAVGRGPGGPGHDSITLVSAQIPVHRILGSSAADRSTP